MQVTTDAEPIVDRGRGPKIVRGQQSRAHHESDPAE